MAKHVVAATTDIPPGSRKLVQVNGRAVVLFNLGGEFFALNNRCPHRGGSLCDGVTTGLVQSREPGAKLVEGPYQAETFPVSVENDYLVVEA